MGNYRTKLRMAGCPELQVNSRPSGPKRKLKKAKKNEVNFLPALPEGTTQNALEEERLEILEEMKKKTADVKKVEQMMANTFSLRRKEIVEEEPPVSEVKKKWPALFTEQQIKAEFNRITSSNLTECFYTGLDQHFPRLLHLYRAKMERIPPLKNLLRKLEDDNSITMKRTVALKGLPYLLNEDPSGFLKTAEATEPEEEMTQGVGVGLILVRDGVDPLDIAVVLENQILLHNIGDLPKAMAMLMGLLYVVNIDYPKELRYTFEVIQKVLMNIGGEHCSAKIHGLRNKLLQGNPAGELWGWLRAQTVALASAVEVLDISWFTESMRAGRPVAVESRDRIQTRHGSYQQTQLWPSWNQLRRKMKRKEVESEESGEKEKRGLGGSLPGSLTEPPQMGLMPA
ncbi:uncharacterized protein LOC134441655 [Engraulis encrasicolus]|uniref:uncharacterized protein LOC134441655 n=1 Tax=Engraulis encrasicolus TaxID=184585 RepID=UPI002FD4E87E